MADGTEPSYPKPIPQFVRMKKLDDGRVTLLDMTRESHVRGQLMQENPEGGDNRVGVILSRDGTMVESEVALHTKAELSGKRAAKYEGRLDARGGIFSPVEVKLDASVTPEAYAAQASHLTPDMREALNGYIWFSVEQGPGGFLDRISGSDPGKDSSRTPN